MDPKPKSPARRRRHAPDALLTSVLRRIARRADELWRAGGRVHGTDLECWLQAEREVFRHEVLAGS
jgi:Protein of unknown function (DUF2934)